MFFILANSNLSRRRAVAMFALRRSGLSGVLKNTAEAICVSALTPTLSRLREREQSILFLREKVWRRVCAATPDYKARLPE
jgi:hypothetical protein